MRRLALIAAAALSMGAARPETVDYRLGLDLQPGGAPPLLRVEIRLRGDADGETRLALPDSYGSSKDAWQYLSDLEVKGARAAEDGPAFRVLRHKPNARLVVKYRVRSAYDEDPHWKSGLTYRGAVIRPDWFASRGDLVFAAPAEHEHAPATFRWSQMPKGWTFASDVEHGAMGRPMAVADIMRSVIIGGADVAVAKRPVTGGVLRVASLRSGPIPLERLADQIAATVSAQRSFWNDVTGPYFVGVIPLVRDSKSKVSGGNGLGDGFVIWSTPDVPEFLRWTIAHENTHTWIPERVGRPTPLQPGGSTLWFTEGFTDFFTNRIMLRAGTWSVDDVVGRMESVLKDYDANPARDASPAQIQAEFFKNPKIQFLPYQRGALLALRWDEAIRRKTGGKADLDDVILRMRDHYQQFPPGQGPDVVTGLVSAAWVVARIDLRPDIAKYADGGAYVDLPETMFDGCLDARVTVAPGFDSGFDHAASATAKAVKGVRRRGPAWNSGLRDGMRIDALDLKAGDMTREIVLTVRPAKGGKARTIRYWPYGDNDVETRRLQLATGLSGEALAACGRKIGGL